MPDLRLLIADDHELIRRGLRSLLSTHPGLHLVGEAADGLEAVALAIHLQPDIAILDFSMPGLNAPEATTRILAGAPRTRVLVLSLHDSEPAIREVRQAGAHALVGKNHADHELIPALHAVAANHLFFAGAVIPSHSLSSRTISAASGDLATLTAREREIMSLLAAGLTSRQAAAELHISIRTVESHRVNISRKLGLCSIADLVRYAIRHGIAAHP